MFDSVKHRKIKINSCFSTEKHLAYRSTYNLAKDKIRHIRALEAISVTTAPIITFEKIGTIGPKKLHRNTRNFI